MAIVLLEILFITYLMNNGFKGELKRVEFVGPQVGSELRDQGGLGMLVALIYDSYVCSIQISVQVCFRSCYSFGP